MRSSLIKSCLLALATASTVVAQIAGFDSFTQPSTPGSSIPAGKTYTIKWTPSAPAGKISIYLLEGPSNTTLQIGPKIATSIDSSTGSYDWAVPSTGLEVFPYYGFKLQLDSDPTTFQYSTYFSITGLAASGSSAGSGGVSTTTVASKSVTVKVSQVGSTTSASKTTVSASHVTVNSTSTTSTSTSIYPISTLTTTTSKAATSTASTTSTSPSPSSSSSSSSGAGGSVIVGGTSLIGAFFVALGMLL